MINVCPKCILEHFSYINWTQQLNTIFHVSQHTFPTLTRFFNFIAHILEQLHQYLYNRKSASFFKFLLKIYPHQSFYITIHFQNCRIFTRLLQRLFYFIYFLFFLSHLSSDYLSSLIRSLYSSTLFVLLSSLKSNNKSSKFSNLI